MAFFEDLGKKISQAGQTAVQKTKDITDLAKLNGAISEQEKKQADMYAEIGKLYVSKYSENCDSDFEGMIAALKECENKICEFRQQVQNIKGVMKCEKCGAEIGKDFAFCNSCGAKAPSATVPQTNENSAKCAVCGATVSETAKFCVVCGNAIANSVTDGDQQAENDECVKNGNVCSVCGATMADGIVFCTRCGNKVQ